MTFEDGPTPDVTDKALDILKEYGAKATFFCKGINVEKHPEHYKRILSEVMMLVIILLTANKVGILKTTYILMILDYYEN